MRVSGKRLKINETEKNIQFVPEEFHAKKLTAKPNFKSFRIINEHLCSVYSSIPKIKWDKPTPVGAPILDLSKLALYHLHYNEMKPCYGEKNCVTYKDTDSLLYRIETHNLYEDMQHFKHILDLSDYPPLHPLYDPVNKMVPLTMTVELNGEILQECVVLRSKMYSIQIQSETKQSAKGVQKLVKKTLHHDK